jgi:hypothetical protein
MKPVFLIFKETDNSNKMKWNKKLDILHEMKTKQKIGYYPNW